MTGALTYKWAAVAEKFHLTPAQIGDLTEWQIDRLLFHRRDKDGVLVPPAEPDKPAAPPTRESRLAGIAQLEAMGLINTQTAAELRGEVEARFGETPAGPSPGS